MKSGPVDFVKRHLYYGARRYFDGEKRTAIKQWLGLSRKKLARAYQIVYGRFDVAELMGQLREMIREDFDILMIHSAYDKLLPMYSGTPQEIVNELIAFCGPERTLAMPAFVLGAPEYDVIKYYKRIGKFDVKRTISEMGIVSEIFRRKTGVKRSLHPTHSVCALGPLAEALTATHHLAPTRLGKGSPFEVMAQKRTIVIGIGVEYYRSLTQAKSVEDIMGDSFPVPSTEASVNVKLIAEDRAELTYPLTVRTFAQRTQGSILRTLLSSEELMERKFHGVPLWRTSAGRVTTCLLEAASQGITFYGKVSPENQRPARGDVPVA